MNILRDFLPQEAFSGEFDSERFMRYLDIPVTASYERSNGKPYVRWPASHKNVHSWWLLENGMAVGWNENAHNGFSFPVASKSQVARRLNHKGR